MSTNLPVQLTSFIGREQELVDVERLVSTSHLVTLTGAGGCGKTRLAIQIGNTLGNDFSDGVWLIDFVPLHEPELVLQHIAQTFDLHPSPNQSIHESVLNFIRTKHMLLILDNCEHLITAIAQFVQQLRVAAPNLNILATSRQPLALAGEMIYSVQGLAWPSIESAISVEPEDLKQHDAIHLFVERARGISPQFKITADNKLAVVEICRRLDGIPLALELASARLNILTAQQIAARLDSRFHLLNSVKSMGTVTHHQTLRAAIDWSYDLLTSEEQTLLRRLAVFGAGCTLDMAESVCAWDEVAKEHTLELISSLVDKSLMVAETSGRTEARYRLLEMIREYALEKLKDSGESKRLRDRHLDFFVMRVEEIAPKLQQGSAYQGLWMTWLDGEMDNIRAALEWSLGSNQVEVGLRLVVALLMFWTSHGSMQEGINWHGRLLGQADEQVPILLRARAALNAGMLAGLLGDTTSAYAYEQTIVVLCEAAGKEGAQLLAQAQAPTNMAALINGDFAVVYANLERSIKLSRKVGNELELPFDLTTQAVAAIGLGKFQVAHVLLEEALPAQQKVGDPWRAAMIVSFLGHLEHWEKNYERAEVLYEKALAGLREVGGTNEEPRVVQGMAHAHLQRGDLEQAYKLMCESITSYKSQGNTQGLGECLIGFGTIAAERDMPTEAVRLLTTGATHGKSLYLALLLSKGKEYDRYLTVARSQLTEHDFEQAQQAGRSQTLEGAIEYALSLPLMSTTPTSKVHPESGGLTEREREIVALIVEGKRNSEIAEQLVLSKRTVEKHVANILSKLELTSRAQIVRWAIEHNLTK